MYFQFPARVLLRIKTSPYFGAFYRAPPADENINMLLFVILYILNCFVYKNFIFIHYSFGFMHIYTFSDEYSPKRNNIYKFFAEKY